MSRCGPVLFRCDVGPTVGVGHLMRCIALAEELRSREVDVCFATDVASVPFAARQLRSRGFACVPAAHTAEEHRQLVDAVRPSLAVLDSYRLSADVYAAVRSAGVPVLALVDGGPAADRPADVYVNANLGAEASPADLPEGATYLGGVEYALMRDDILEGRPLPVPMTGSTPRVFMFFGGTDPLGAAPVLTRALIATGLPFQATVVAGSPDSAAMLRDLRATAEQLVTVIGPTSRLVRELRAADCVVSASGTSTWELMCLGAAAGLVCVVDNQRAGYAAVTATGGVLGLGLLSQLRTGGTTPALGTLLSDAGERERLRSRARELVDGRGRVRVADVALDLLTSRGACLG